MTDKEFVVERYAAACLHVNSKGKVAILPARAYVDAPLGRFCSTENGAWASAANNIRNKESTRPSEIAGSG